ncbi:MAG: hypothetical protein K0R38_3071 [Polyangiaceae bacterium]|jgi:hypothetical protein|nr:hypothetical protein [Polyangiaceae bacterium]
MGLTRCEEGYRYRAQPQACSYRANEGPAAGGAGGGAQTGEGGAGGVDCGECEGEHAFCRANDTRSPFGCSQGCLTDEECGDDSFCLCDGERGGFCVDATCRGDADCDGGYHCAEVESPCEQLVGNFACQKPVDECLTSAACDDATCMLSDPYFASGRPERRRCDDAVCGRPFLVEASVRVAATAARSDWTENDLTPEMKHLTAAERAAEAAHWTKLAQMEHASIAAFARFQLQLLALGAPADLVNACNQALVDETKHARLCFALASAYAGRSVGPGALDVTHSLDATSLADIVELVIAEGCFGETSAALEALESADVATDPVVAGIYRTIAADEQRHAELAFRFVRWALQRDGQGVRECVARAVAEAASSSPEARLVTVPCLTALLGAERLAIAEPPFCASCATA